VAHLDAAAALTRAPARLCRRYIDFPWKSWADPEEGGAGKASKLL
jgi:hypothetical protein